MQLSWNIKKVFVVVVVCLFLKTGFLCVADCSGTHSVDPVGLKLTEICLPLSPEFWQ